MVQFCRESCSSRPENQVTLDHDAFQVFQIISSAAEPSFSDEENVKSVYYPEVEKLILEKVPGAHRVFIFDHTIRRTNPGAERAPVFRAHIDQTPAVAVERVGHYLPEEAEQSLSAHYRITNVWRALNELVQVTPLTFAAATSVRDEDIVGIEHR
ncbi:uncharacterized protein PADG_00801 [Paracoccidioides brasiliensis Pb18]|uniref:Uncharacterized protein n=1 Tax=Paracoccidioides brasiliensis (strain Pb18) TaxID=502780 RepID=C1FYC5_PARBD|nr:uncharacterized protein PADG_00801 [Paracoccidioides brasiliensis Pb18]EEH44512.2 hypothetical protein PADG_00801 [Paracoccidioides brasiliensis Pb18]